MDLLAEAARMSDQLIDLRRRLHARPEVGLDLPVTQRILLAELDGLGLEVQTGVGLTSIIAILRGGHPGPLVLLRGDMDALPVVERTGESFAAATGSAHAQAMHACGHDLHMAGLVGAARLLSAHRAELAGDFVSCSSPARKATTAPDG